MHIETLTLKNENKLIQDYKGQDNNLMNFFDYKPFNTYKKRLKELENRTYNRKELTKTLRKLNKGWDAPSKTLEVLEQLNESDSVVVVGGQQAGLLTGPMYTVHKIISIIQLAKKQQEILGIPVVPVFWIAGEDHDYEEINHTYLLRSNYFEKHKLNQKMFGKPSVSNIPKQEKLLNEFLEEVFLSLRETEYTKDIINSIQEAAKKSHTYVDFFARLIFNLFPNEGIVLLDSGNEDIRNLQSLYFEEMINKQDLIAQGVYSAKQELEQSGYSIMLDLKKTSGHLFYEENQNRLLLEKTSKGTWIDKDNQVEFSKEELLKIAKDNPQKLSNNVVTRPLMQELLLPTLAFVAGNGEIAYWSTLRPAFEALNLKMPPVLPRLSFTFINHKIVKTLSTLSMSLQNVLEGETDSRKVNWLRAQTTRPTEEVSTIVKQSIDTIHEPLRNIAKEIREDIGQLADANLAKIQKEIDFLQGKMIRATQEKYKVKIDQFDYLKQVVFPFNQLQERIWNPYSWINEYGTNFIGDLCKEDFSFKDNHYIVYL